MTLHKLWIRPEVCGFSYGLSALLWWFGVLVAMFVSGAARGQKLNIKSYTVDQGIPQNQVLAVFRDSTGYLWIGTYSGLARYNGHGWAVFDKRRGLTRNHITSITEDGRGRILAGTREGGLNLFDGSEFQGFPESDFLGACTVADLLTDRRGRVWIAAKEGLAVLDGEKARLVLDSGGESLKFCNTLWERADGTIWVGMREGLAFIERDVAQRLSFSVLQNKEVTAVVEDAEGRLFVASDKGLFTLKNESLQPFSSPSRPVPDKFLCGTRDGQGRLWLGTSGKGLMEIGKEGVTVIDKTKGLEDGMVRSLCSDPEGILWIGTDSGLNKYLSGPFLVYTKDHGLAHNFVRALFLDKSKRLWIGTRDGISILEEGHHFGTFDTSAFPSRQIYSIAQTPSGDMIFATSGGLVVQEGGRIKSYTMAEGLHVDFVRSVFVDSKARIWVGTEGLARLTERGIENLPADHLLSNVRIVQIIEDTNGWLWLGTEIGPVGYQPETDSVRIFEEYGDVTVWSLDYDGKGHLWMGTNGKGLLRFDGSRFQRYDSRTGLGNDYVWQVLCADNGDIWAGHNKGLDRISNGRITHFSKRDGLADNEGAATACIQDGRGNLWFGTGSGLTRYESDLKQKAVKPPTIYLESVSVNHEPVPLKSKASFERKRNNFQFRFAALSFTQEEDVRYSFKLEGLDRDWSEPTAETYSNYFNLGPGTYRFMVRSIAGNGFWAEQPATYAFVVLPAFWETAWFRIMAGILALFLIGVYVKFKLRRLQERKHELERTILEKTEALQIANSDLKKAQEHLVETAHRAGMAEIATGILHNVGNILNSINVSVEEIQKVATTTNATHFLKRFLQLMEGHRHDLAAFLTENDQGLKVPLTLNKTLDLLEKMRRKILSELNHLRQQLHHINEIVRTQQDYAKVDSFFNAVDINTVVEDSLRIQNNFLKAAEVVLALDLNPLPLVKIPKIKLMQVIINLIRNGAEATCDLPPETERRLKISTRADGGIIQIRIADNGKGIQNRQKDLIFSYGFTTKEDGHGFGLHFCANAMTEMGGAIHLDSDGAYKGAVFTLELPVASETPETSPELANAAS